MALPEVKNALDIGENGLLISSGTDLVWIGSGVDDPSQSPGIAAPLGSIYYRTNGKEYKKIDSLDTDWIISGIDTAIGSVVPFDFSASGNTGDKWLGYGRESSPSNQVPFVLPQNMSVKGITFSNEDDNVDQDIQLFVNGVLEHTEEIRNKRWYYHTGIPNLDYSVGDRLSIYAKRITTGSGDSTSQNPIVTIYVKFTGETQNQGGGQYGV